MKYLLCILLLASPVYAASLPFEHKRHWSVPEQSVLDLQFDNKGRWMPHKRFKPHRKHWFRKQHKHIDIDEPPLLFLLGLIAFVVRRKL